MSLEKIGAILLFLLVIVIAGNIWFYTVESILSKIKKLFTGHNEPPAWHALPAEQEEKKDSK